MNMFPAGGANAVAAWIIEALKDEYELTLLSEVPVDWAAVNHFFGTSIRDKEVSVIVLSVPLRSLLRLDPDPGSIQPLAYLMRVCRRIRHKFDLVMSAATEELDLGGPGMLYVHYPGLSEFWRSHLDWGGRPLLSTILSLARGKIRPWVLLSGYSIDRMKQCRILTNSDWTGALFQERYGVPTATVYPPVTPAPSTLPWHLRENSFAAVGRVVPPKRFDWIIDLLESLRQKHPDLRLHLVGTRDPEHAPSSYYSSLLRKVRSHNEWLTFSENLSRSELLRLLGRVRYALSAKEQEHFGIAPAEALLAGCIPFVHDSGGQVEIVGHDLRLCFSDREDAVRKIERLLINPDLQLSLQAFLQTRRGLFTAERFKTEFKRIVRETLNQRCDD